MALLFGTCYDPAVAVSKPTTALLAMTALDTTNLRAAFTIPANGTVLVHMRGVLHGATTCPQILLGVMSGATVLSRVAPLIAVSNLAATSFYTADALFIVKGLTPGAAAVWDAAYGVETIVAATGLRYGGPNDVVANNATGGFTYEIWTT